MIRSLLCLLGLHRWMCGYKCFFNIANEKGTALNVKQFVNTAER